MGLFQSLFGSRPGPSVRGVNAHELQTLIEGEEPVTLIDVRSEYEFVQGHIAGAELLPLQELMAGGVRLPDDQSIVFVCRVGNRSRVACQLVMEMGLSQVINFEGGMVAWQIAGLPVVKGPS